MTSFHIQFNTNNMGFGPNTSDTQTLSNCLKTLEKSPFEPNLIIESLGKTCDFTLASKQRQKENRYNTKQDDELNFQPVETHKSNKLVRQPYGQSNRNNTHTNNQKKPKGSTDEFIQKQQVEIAMHMSKKKQSEIRKLQEIQKNKQKRNNMRHKNYNVWSIEPIPDWRNVCEIELNKLSTHIEDISKIKVRDIQWTGCLRYYNKQMDRITPRNPIELNDYTHKMKFYWPTTTEDEIIHTLLENETMNIHVAATTHILSILMSSPPSRYSWHLEIFKIEGKIIIDKPHTTMVDLITVNETSNEPPSQDCENKLNRPWSLGVEAVKINQNFTQHVLDHTCIYKQYQQPCFIDDDDLHTSNDIAYRYRLYTLPSNGIKSSFGDQPLHILTRADVHCALRTPMGEESLAALYTVNEFDINSKKNWSKQIEHQKGTLLITEIGHNTCRLQKYVLSATLGGCDTIKLGFATRQSAHDNDKHNLLMIQSLKTEDFATQVGLNMANAWGIVRHILEIIMAQPDGKYIIVKDPTKQILRIYEQKEHDNIITHTNENDSDENKHTHTNTTSQTTQNE